MVANFIAGRAAINQIARLAAAELRVIPIELDRPTADFTVAPAMDQVEFLAALNIGYEAVPDRCDRRLREGAGSLAEPDVPCGRARAGAAGDHGGPGFRLKIFRQRLGRDERAPNAPPTRISPEHRARPRCRGGECAWASARAGLTACSHSERVCGVGRAARRAGCPAGAGTHRARRREAGAHPARGIALGRRAAARSTRFSLAGSLGPDGRPVCVNP
jgi:hypothetical protein